MKTTDTTIRLFWFVAYFSEIRVFISFLHRLQVSAQMTEISSQTWVFLTAFLCSLEQLHKFRVVRGLWCGWWWSSYLPNLCFRFSTPIYEDGRILASQVYFLWNGLNFNIHSKKISVKNQKSQGVEPIFAKLFCSLQRHHYHFDKFWIKIFYAKTSSCIKIFNLKNVVRPFIIYKVILMVG